ncbi:SPOSA6832_02843, partial [Sporobolomyces salmonicolor]
MGLQFFQQATGFNCLMYFSAKILHQTHLSAPATFAIFVAVSNFACTLVALRLIDRVGRRTLLLRGLAGMAVGMAVLAGAFGFIPDQGEVEHGAGAAAYAALLGMVGFCCAYALSLGNVPWVVQSEVRLRVLPWQLFWRGASAVRLTSRRWRFWQVFNQDLRALGTGLATATNWIANLLVSSTFLHLSRALTPSGVFALYAFISLLGWLFTWRYLPETKGLSLEEVRRVFETE